MRDPINQVRNNRPVDRENLGLTRVPLDDQSNLIEAVRITPWWQTDAPSCQAHSGPK